MPEPLEVDPPPPYPTTALPERLRPFVEASAVSIGVDPAMVAGPAFAAIAACSQRLVVIEPKPGWFEVLLLWWLGVAHPGERKSAAIAAATQPLRALERLLDEQGRDERREHAERRRELKAKLDALRKQLNRADEEDRPALREELAKVSERFEDLGELHLPRRLADDATPEALTLLMAQQEGRIACVSGEAAGLLGNAAGRYSNGASNLSSLLQAWSGEDIRVDRIGRDPVAIERPALTLALMVQPDRLASLTATSGDLRGQGVWSRFLFAAPPSRVGQQTWSTPPVPSDVMTAWAATVQGLDDRLRRLSEPLVLPSSTQLRRGRQLRGSITACSRDPAPAVTWSGWVTSQGSCTARWSASQA